MLAVESSNVVDKLGFDPAGIDSKLADAVRGFFANKGRLVNNFLVERQNGRKTFDLHLAQGTTGASQSLGAVGAGNNEFGHH